MGADEKRATARGIILPFCSETLEAPVRCRLCHLATNRERRDTAVSNNDVNIVLKLFQINGQI